MEVRGSICKCFIYLFSIYFLLHVFCLMWLFLWPITPFLFTWMYFCLFAHVFWFYMNLLFNLTPPSLTELIIYRERWHYSRWLIYYYLWSKMSSFTPKGVTILLTISIFNSSFYSPSFISCRDLLFYVHHIRSVSCDYYIISIFWFYCGGFPVRHFVFFNSKRPRSLYPYLSSQSIKKYLYVAISLACYQIW